MWLVVGLGNPGKEYASHRHNVGFMAVDRLADKLRADSFRDKFSGSFTKASSGDSDLVLLKPLTFMNLSGQCVQPAAAFFKVEPSRVLVVHDEIDLPFADVRLKLGGGHAGHNGLRSIVQCLGTADFPRVRVGVGRPGAGFKGEVASWVLSSFDASERAELDDVLQRAVDSVLDVLARGLTPAMNKLNTKASGALGSSQKGKANPGRAAALSKNETPRSDDDVGAVSPRGKA